MRVLYNSVIYQCQFPGFDNGWCLNEMLLGEAKRIMYMISDVVGHLPISLNLS